MAVKKVKSSSKSTPSPDEREIDPDLAPEAAADADDLNQIDADDLGDDDVEIDLEDDDESDEMSDGESTDESADESDDESAEPAWLQDHRLELAQQRASAVAAGRRKAGMAGAAMAGAMLAMRDIIEGPPKDDSTVEIEASSDPIDLDSDGFEMTVGEVAVTAPPLERLEPDHHRQRPRWSADRSGTKDA